jgi:hypothetical protein
MKINKQLILIVAILVGGVVAYAQTLSPYSRYGYGLVRDHATSAQRAMGGVGYAMSGGRQINVMNPASYAAVDSMTFLFDMGLDLTYLKSTDGDEAGSNFGGGLDYITMQFPLCRYMGASIGLVPFTSVGYAFGSTIDNGAATHSGSGGINELYVGVAGRPFKGFTLGANISYLFGTTINDSYAVGDATTLFERVIQVRDWRVQLGLQYGVNIGRRHRVSAGLTYTPGKTLLGHAWAIQYEVSSTTTVTPDTLSTTTLKDKYSLPSSWGAGLSYEFDKRLLVEFDYTYQNWRDAKYTALEGMDKLSFNNRFKAAAGVQFVPRHRGNYMQRINYRIGGYSSRDYLTVLGNNIREYGLSCGLGMPLNTTKTMVNIGFEYVHRKGTPNPLIKENYFNITVGINFHQLWFDQNKIR